LKFFIPTVCSGEQATQIYGALRTFVADNVGSLSPRRIYRISYKHNGKFLKAEVGRPDPLFGETIIAIFSSRLLDQYFLCTKNRGVNRGDPILAGAAETTFEDFDHEDESR
jgi:hypothetical protein